MTSRSGLRAVGGQTMFRVVLVTVSAQQARAPAENYYFAEVRLSFQTDRSMRSKKKEVQKNLGLSPSKSTGKSNRNRFETTPYEHPRN